VFSIVIPIARYLGLTKSNPPGANCIGWFHCYDGNMWGGALIGTGMALTGACPGTVLPQIVTGVRSGIFVGIGGVLGAIYFTRNVFRGPDRDIHVISSLEASDSSSDFIAEPCDG
jgi:uncharacterized membrane protein YedE/YeeE